MRKYLRTFLAATVLATAAAVAGPAAPAAAVTWGLTLTPATANTAAGSTVRLDARTFTSVTGTGYHIAIWQWGGVNWTLLNSCSVGTTCTTHAFISAGEKQFIATVASPSSSFPAVTQARTSTVTVFGWTVSLSAPAKVLPTQPASLFASTNKDVSPTPYVIYIEDTLTGAIVASCGSGSSCSGTATEILPTCRTFRARVSTVVYSATRTVCWTVP